MWKWHPAAAAVLGGAIGALIVLVIVLVCTFMPWNECQPGSMGALGERFPIAAPCGSLIVDWIAFAGYLYVASRAPRPSELHWHGLLLFLMLPEVLGQVATATFLCKGHFTEFYATSAGTAALFGFRRAFLLQLMVKKMDALGAPPKPRYCVDTRFWGNLATASVLVGIYFGIVAARVVSAVCIGTGMSYEDTLDAFTRLDGVKVPMIIFFFCGMLFTLSSLSFLCAARRKSRAAIGMLAERQATKEALDAAVRTLQRHRWGLLVSVVTTSVLFLCTITHDILFPGGEHFFLLAVPQMVDHAGDLVGIMLLSGIGELLFHEDPEDPDTGDVCGHIRSLLHTAVLTARADTVFEGRVVRTHGNACIVSFPGKFVAEWQALTWLCELGELSSACVFLPKSDPKQRFGKHSDHPDKPHMCWCHELYGEMKPWGCVWFVEWKANVEAAVRLELDLVVVSFPGERGMGRVAWDSLRSADLWDGVGLGGSQKAEVAYLEKMGYKFLEQDVNECRCRFGSRRCMSPDASRRSSRMSMVTPQTATPMTPNTGTPATPASRCTSPG